MPNRILPEFWKYDPALCALRRDTRLFFFHLGLSVDDYWRCAIGPSPQEPSFLRSTCLPCDQDVRLADVTRYLHELKVAGAIVVGDSERGWYVEIVERLRYRREDHREGQPRYGPRLQKPAEQPPLPGGLLSVAAPPTQVNRRRNRNKVESESAPGAGNRAVCREKESSDTTAPGLHARWIDALPGDDLWRTLCETLGRSEMTARGALWIMRLETSRTALAHALEDLRVKPPTDRATIQNPAAYVTQRFAHYVRNVA